MSEDERRIRALITRWADAVHRGDLEAVLADHAEDLRLYYVTPPHEGLRGLAAYRALWPPFFAWQAQGALFEIDVLDVASGPEVAFAHALLRCGTPEELAERPTLRLRLTFGLRKRRGRWVITHEHHSFPHD
ncbi:nuclear transport factor 2 family protein [Streptomyces bobili]|uniref:nuclear transport factor 2 family protein n=1 Tax=Streptomyces bobili TaxID=67280 RepID=UPI000A3C0805|nr:nuclear transport factor 2 family protein [Streptomyces bobili]